MVYWLQQTGKTEANRNDKKQTGDKKLPETEKNVTRMYPIYDIMDTTTGNSKPKKTDIQNSLKPRKCNRYVSTV